MTSTRQRGVTRIARALTAAGLAGVGVIAADVPISILSPNQLHPVADLRIATPPAAAVAPATTAVASVSYTTVTAVPGAASPVSIPLLHA